MPGLRAGFDPWTSRLRTMSVNHSGPQGHFGKWNKKRKMLRYSADRERNDTLRISYNGPAKYERLSAPYYEQFNPLTPELNPSAQRCLTKFFTGDFASLTVHFVNICVKNQQMQQLFIQFINYGSSYMFRYTLPS
jgi:hypothetical protein